MLPRSSGMIKSQIAMRSIEIKEFLSELRFEWEILRFINRRRMDNAVLV